MRDRIKSLRRVKASELRANPKNWRHHPEGQRTALQSVLNEIGLVDAVIARETDDGLELLDGHLRADVSGDEKIPVLVVDVTDQEAAVVLATLDPLSAMAESSSAELDALLRTIEFESDAVAETLRIIAEAHDLYTPELDPETGTDEVTDEDVRETEGVLDSQFDDAGTAADEIREVVCPHCGALFEISK